MSIAKTKVSKHTCVFDSMWTFQQVLFRTRLSWPHTTPPPPLSLISIPDEAVWRTTNFFLTHNKHWSLWDMGKNCSWQIFQPAKMHQFFVKAGKVERQATKCRLCGKPWFSSLVHFNYSKELRQQPPAFLIRNITAIHHKHTWETGKPKSVEIGADLGARNLHLKSICTTFSPMTPFFYWFLKSWCQVHLENAIYCNPLLFRQRTIFG